MVIVLRNPIHALTKVSWRFGAGRNLGPHFPRSSSCCRADVLEISSCRWLPVVARRKNRAPPPLDLLESGWNGPSAA